MKKTYVQALAIAVLPPIWAALATIFGFTTGAVSLITAGLVMLTKDSGWVLSGSLLIGDIWGSISFELMTLAPPSLNILIQVVVLGLFGFLAVLLSSLSKKISLVSWLMGWAMTIQILSMTPKSKWPVTVLMIGISMVVGIFYVGYGIKYITNKFG